MTIEESAESIAKLSQLKERTISFRSLGVLTK